MKPVLILSMGLVTALLLAVDEPQTQGCFMTEYLPQKELHHLGAMDIVRARKGHLFIHVYDPARLELGETHASPGMCYSLYGKEADVAFEKIKKDRNRYVFGTFVTNGRPGESLTKEEAFSQFDSAIAATGSSMRPQLKKDLKNWIGDSIDGKNTADEFLKRLPGADKPLLFIWDRPRVVVVQLSDTFPSVSTVVAAFVLGGPDAFRLFSDVTKNEKPDGNTGIFYYHGVRNGPPVMTIDLERIRERHRHNLLPRDALDEQLFRLSKYGGPLQVVLTHDTLKEISNLFAKGFTDCNIPFRGSRGSTPRQPPTPGRGSAPTH